MWIDLSHTLEEGMPVYPKTLPIEIIQSNSLEIHGFREKTLKLCSHTGTHMDAPSHMLKEGHHLDDYPISKFTGKGIVINIKEQDDLKKFEEKIKKVDFVLFYTSWSDLWGKKQYFEGFPCLKPKNIDYILSFSLKGIGFDAISIDPVGKNFDNHYKVFSKDLVIIENLKGLKPLVNQIFDFVALPLKIKEADGSPIRAMASIEIKG